MTSIRLVEFQQDKSEVFFSEIVKKTKTRIEYLVSQFNLQFEIDTIFSYSLIESGFISNSSYSEYAKSMREFETPPFCSRASLCLFLS